MAVPEVCSRASSGRAAPGSSGWPGAPRRETGALGAQPLPRVFERAASKAAHFAAFDTPQAAADALFGEGSDVESEAESEVGFALQGAEAAADALFGVSGQGAIANPFGAEPEPPAAMNPFGGRPPEQVAVMANPFGDAPPNPFVQPPAPAGSNPF